MNPSDMVTPDDLLAFDYSISLIGAESAAQQEVLDGE